MDENYCRICLADGILDKLETRLQIENILDESVADLLSLLSGVKVCEIFRFLLNLRRN